MRRLFTPYIDVLMFVYIIGRVRKIAGLDELFGAPHCFVTPKVCPNENVTFYLYTSENPTTPFEMTVIDPASIEHAKFLNNAPIKVIIHGYTGHKDYSPNMELRPGMDIKKENGSNTGLWVKDPVLLLTCDCKKRKSAIDVRHPALNPMSRRILLTTTYFERPVDVNIISVDYANLVREPCYFQAVENSDVAASCTAQFLEELLKIRSDIEPTQIHIIGLSLGAQVAGQISNYFTLGKIERITALDAALPLFYSVVTPESRQINRGDAKFIDAIHTNGGIKGKLLPFADVDFFANGGSLQPPCGNNHSCNHAFSAVLFALSINSDVVFWGHSCSFYTYFLGYCQESQNPWALFGEYVSPDAHGSYFFRTSDHAPYTLPPEDRGNYKIYDS